MQKIINSFEKKTSGTNTNNNTTTTTNNNSNSNSNSNNNNNNNNNNNSNNNNDNSNNNNNSNNNTNKIQTVTIPWVLKIRPNIKKEIQKFGFRVAFQTVLNLKNILCKIKDKLIPNSHPGVYKLKSSCELVYNGETKKKIISRSSGIPRLFRIVTAQNSLHEK